LDKLLTISSSYRTKGNGEVLLDMYENFLSESQYNKKRLYLRDFSIKTCTGCMGCAINKEFCKIEDDLRKLIDQILISDVLIISAPVYFLGASSITKAIGDRLLGIHNLLDYSKRKPAGIIITAGREEWEGLAIQNLSILLLSLGFYIKDVLVAHGQGPSEVVLDPDIKNKIEIFTKNIANPDYKVPNISNKCPVCFGESFNILDKSKIKCAICNLSGEIIGNKDEILISFPEDAINNSRWSADNLKDHMENWVEGSIQRYKEKIREIMKLRNSIKVSINKSK